MKKIILPHLTFTIERWKYNPRCKSYVSTLGRFKNSKGEFLEPKVGHKTGYIHVQTECGWETCHRLVLETWKPKKDMSDLTVDHINHNKRDNRLCNLEWVTQEENQSRATADLLLDAKKQENFGTPQIKCGARTFNTFDEVAYFLLDKGKISSYNKTNKQTIKKNILKSIKKQTKYCNYNFEIL